MQHQQNHKYKQANNKQSIVTGPTEGGVHSSPGIKSGFQTTTSIDTGGHSVHGVVEVVVELDDVVDGTAVADHVAGEVPLSSENLRQQFLVGTSRHTI